MRNTYHTFLGSSLVSKLWDIKLLITQFFLRFNELEKEVEVPWHAYQPVPALARPSVCIDFSTLTFNKFQLPRIDASILFLAEAVLLIDGIAVCSIDSK